MMENFRIKTVAGLIKLRNHCIEQYGYEKKQLSIETGDILTWLNVERFAIFYAAHGGWYFVEEWVAGKKRVLGQFSWHAVIELIEGLGIDKSVEQELKEELEFDDWSRIIKLCEQAIGKRRWGTVEEFFLQALGEQETREDYQ